MLDNRSTISGASGELERVIAYKLFNELNKKWGFICDLRYFNSFCVLILSSSLLALSLRYHSAKRCIKEVKETVNKIYKELATKKKGVQILAAKKSFPGKMLLIIIANGKHTNKIDKKSAVI